MYNNQKVFLLRKCPATVTLFYSVLVYNWTLMGKVHLIILTQCMYSVLHLIHTYFLMCHCVDAECVRGEERFYIVSPIDILLAQTRDVSDHVDWLLQRRNFKVQTHTQLCVHCR